MRRKLRRKRRGGRRKVTATRSSSRHCENGCRWGTEGRIPVPSSGSGLSSAIKCHGRLPSTEGSGSMTMVQGPSALTSVNLNPASKA